jgi:hypothetical protein
MLLGPLAEAELMARIIGTDHFREAMMPRRFSADVRTFLLELVFLTALAVFAWLDPATYAKVFLHVEVAILTVLVLVLVVLLRILYDLRRARRARPRDSSVVVPIRD